MVTVDTDVTEAKGPDNKPKSRPFLRGFAGHIAGTLVVIAMLGGIMGYLQRVHDTHPLGLNGPAISQQDASALHDMAQQVQADSAPAVASSASADITTTCSASVPASLEKDALTNAEAAQVLVSLESMMTEAARGHVLCLREVLQTVPPLSADSAPSLQYLATGRAATVISVVSVSRDYIGNYQIHANVRKLDGTTGEEQLTIGYIDSGWRLL